MERTRRKKKGWSCYINRNEDKSPGKEGTVTQHIQDEAQAQHHQQEQREVKRQSNSPHSHHTPQPARLSHDNQVCAPLQLLVCNLHRLGKPERKDPASTRHGPEPDLRLHVLSQKLHSQHGKNAYKSVGKRKKKWGKKGQDIKEALHRKVYLPGWKMWEKTFELKGCDGWFHMSTHWDQEAQIFSTPGKQQNL